MKQISIGILLFNEVEVLDFTGPFEVFSITSIPDHEEKPFIIKTVSETGKLIYARNGLKVKPDYSFTDAPQFDVLIISGGYGAENIEINNHTLIAWIQKQSPKAKLTTSVCTGALLLAKAGLLDGKIATTHWMDIDRLEAEFPKVKVKRNVKFVDQGSVITSAGISAGINMSFYIIKKLLGDEIAKATAKRMEYDIVI